VEGDEVPSEDGRAVKLKSVWIRADLGQKGLAVECQCGSFSRYRTSCGQCGKKYPADLMRKRNCCDHTYTETKECGICGADLRALWRTKEFLNNMGDLNYGK
jgi:hypothetical protein